MYVYLHTRSFPRWLSGKESACQCRRHRRCGFDPRVGKIPWRRKWQPTPVLLPGKSPGQRSLVDYSPWVATSQTHTAAKPPPSTLVKQLFPVQNASLRCLTGVLKSFLVIKCLWQFTIVTFQRNTIGWVNRKPNEPQMTDLIPHLSTLWLFNMLKENGPWP